MNAVAPALDSDTTLPPAPPQPATPPAAAALAGPTPRQKLGFFAMVFGMFMAILDIQIVSSSLAEIQAGLSASADEISWVQTSYLIAEIIMIPLSGFLSRLLSTRILFCLSAVTFTAMSVACAAASSIGEMVLLRALQGFLGGAMIPTVFATSFILFPGAKRVPVSVMMGLVATLAPTIGPTLGGYLTQWLSWHWLFLINLAPGLLIAALVWHLLDIDRPDWSLLKHFDYAGLLFMAVFLGSLEYVVDEGPRHDWLADAVVRNLAITCAAAGVLFFWRVLSYHQPIVDLRAFADRNFTLGCLFSFVLGIGLYGAVYLVPLFLARVRGLNSLQIGEIMFVTGLFQFLSAPLAGRLARVMDLRAMLALGLALFGSGVYLMSFMTADWDFWELFWPQALRGISLMLCFLPINTLALGTLPPHKLKNASGLYNLMRNLGGAIGLALINTLLLERFNLHWARLGEQINPVRPEVQLRLESLTQHLSGLVDGDPHAAAIRLLGRQVQQQALVLTFNDCLLAMAAVFFLALLFMPLLRRPQQAAGGAAH
ncbi:MAG TPA: DHA2 family efflux MFS transporter permease subunit [Candidatus Competibacteraceae bacterium]|nr:DHA2 family efflux MFS transporter permease subunit [Candidatus Competibacteraceae bacterium]